MRFFYVCEHCGDKNYLALRAEKRSDIPKITIRIGGLETKIDCGCVLAEKRTSTFVEMCAAGAITGFGIATIMGVSNSLALVAAVIGVFMFLFGAIEICRNATDEEKVEYFNNS